MSSTQLQINVTGESGNVASRFQLVLVNNSTSITYTSPNLLDGGEYNPPAAIYTVDLSDFVNGGTPFTFTLGDSCTLEAVAIDNAGQLSTTPFTASFFGALVPLLYYSTQADAVAGGTNYIGYSTAYSIQTEGGISSWMIASNSSGSSTQSATYYTGATLNSDGLYYLYPSAACFLEGSLIRCLIGGEEKDVPIETVHTGTLVKTEVNGYKPVALIGHSYFSHLAFEERIENQLYVCPMTAFPELTADLVLTGAHSILVDQLPATHTGEIFVTGKKYRLPSHLDERTTVHPVAGTYTVWHLALENSDIYTNYGVYANGLLVETTSIRYLRELSNMTLV